MDYLHELTAQERAVLVAERLIRGERLTNEQVIELCGYSNRSSAYTLMMRIARVLPVVFCGGQWFVVDGS
jgi:hypothetical protein